MDRFKRFFKGHPSQEKVLDVLLKSGIKVVDGVPYCNDIQLSDAAIARAADVDRRVVKSTMDKINSDPWLKKFFSKMMSIALFSEVSEEMDCTTIEIVPEDARAPGILSDVTAAIYVAGISVRQAVVVDHGRSEEQHLVLVLDGIFPAEHLSALRNCRGVRSVTLR